jgi:glycosyltransferase involved in cell wall biosynthesis
LDIKYKILAIILALIEHDIVSTEKCAYLGEDEINSLPKKYRKNGLIFPFYIDAQSYNYFNNNGYIVFVGNYNFRPNRLALNKILEIAPKIHSKIKIFGPNVPPNNKIPKNVEIAGFSESLDDVFSGAKALIYPVPYGTGIKNKVIEAMSYGIPVIGFRNAFTNLNLEDKKNMIVVKRVSEIISTLNNVDLSFISSNAYSYIIKNLSKQTVLRQIGKYI